MTKLWESLMARVPTHECTKAECGELHFEYNLHGSRGMPPGCPDCHAPLKRIASSTRGNMALFQWMRKQALINSDGSSTGRELLKEPSDEMHDRLRPGRGM